MKKIVALTGAGISAESGLATFRGSDGLWEGHRIEDVATPEGWAKNPALVLDFYNQRRAAARVAQPNAGHLALAGLEDQFEVVVITQNVDDLHERAGSTKVLHLHGKLFESRSSRHEELVYPMSSDRIELGENCAKGYQLRPNIVWFGEAVPMMEVAMEEVETADVLLVAGTSLQVYPAAGLLDYVPRNAPIYVIDPGRPPIASRPRLHFITEPATTGLPHVARLLRQELADE
ncbi:SIR2 family NAD-dependent protein deacylase [Hymenobacter lapidiphilus]|uniref:NAD-dependent protein deacylase n=1 Tax=Hymenobacter lapidiphilus TaxID=2608003 RepID=A0A7Y7U642_9BACT|nr:NAD-dependent deacylase [Hymenobacter lapidiphilus]NVO31125.1 NAD-dependent deacylase [Hymenobacter lapidiphilus]